MPTALRYRAESLAATLPPLLIAAERMAATVAPGVHGRRQAGAGEAFWQFRHGQPGDPAHVIDWRASARSDHLYVREREWEAAQSAWLWCDRSPSMDWRSRPDLPAKERRAALMVLALAVLLVRGGERIAVLGGHHLPATGRAGLIPLALSLEQPLPRPMPGIPAAAPLPRHARCVLVSDFLDPVERIAAAVRAMARRGVTGHMLQVLDPAEEVLPYRGRVRFAGLEGEGAALVGRAESLRDAYRQRMESHRDALRACARNAGWSFAVHHTDAPPEHALMALYAALSTSRTRFDHGPRPGRGSAA